MEGVFGQKIRLSIGSRGSCTLSMWGLSEPAFGSKIGERTNLRVRWAIRDERLFVVGQRVVATIPAEAVRLEAGIFRRSKQQWNRWIGRIVLLESGDMGAVFTVKIHGEG